MMKKLDIEINKLETLLQNKISWQLLKDLKAIQITDVPEVVYTLFDGDHLSHSELMKQFVLKRGLVPLNPEAALGTYLVVNHYRGNKIPIIENCFSLLTKCEYFWIMSDVVPDPDGKFIELLPEGVIAEMIYWMRNIDKKITIVDIKKYRKANDFLYTPCLENFLKPEQKRGIEDIILKPNLRKSVYLAAGEKHAKHSDWMRKIAYTNNTIPLCPYTLINLSTLTLAFKNDFVKKLLSRVSIALRAEEFWIFSSFEDGELLLEKLEDDLLLELFLTLKLRPNTKVFHLYFGEAGVPKYKNRGKWAITEFERSIETA